MNIHNVGYDHRHDADFIIERPEGSGDCLLLLLKTDAVFTVGGRDIRAQEGSVFLYPNGMPQYYRCAPKHGFANDWVHFDFEPDELARFAERDIPYAKPVMTGSAEFLSWCIKAVADEFATDSPYAQENMEHYMWLIFNRVSDSLHLPEKKVPDTAHEMLLTIRRKIYKEPYIPRTVTWAAHEVRMSSASFQYYYKKTFGVTFVQDLINAKTEYARMLLISTNMNVRDIAEKCGYRSYEHFARQFRERTGTTPMEFRRSKRNS